MRIFIRLLCVGGLVIIASCQRSPDTPSGVVADSPQNKVASQNSSNSTTSDPDSMYFPPATLQSLYEYSMEGDTLSRFQKELTMIVRVDGVRTINGKTYFKEVTEYTGQEDLLQLLKSPDQSPEQAEFSQSEEAKSLIKQLESMSEPDVSYMRWDQAGEWDLDSDDLTKPEVLDTPLHVDVGTEWTDAKGLHYKAVSIEDVENGDQVTKDCLKIRVSGSVDKDDMQGTVVYAARGIGVVKIIHAKATFALRKYRR
jgi:hypothetical protein